MRLWSLHPSCLDVRGLTAVWREGLLARAVLGGQTRGYTRHPQLERFRAKQNPVGAVDAYLHAVCDEADARGYRFARSKLGPRTRVTLSVSRGQVRLEWEHLLLKLERRDPARFRAQRDQRPRTHPIFRAVPGGIAPWERRSPDSG